MSESESESEDDEEDSSEDSSTALGRWYMQQTAAVIIFFSFPPLGIAKEKHRERYIPFDFFRFSFSLSTTSSVHWTLRREVCAPRRRSIGAGASGASSGVVTICVCVAGAGLVWSRGWEAMVFGLARDFELSGLTGRSLWRPGLAGESMKRRREYQRDSLRIFTRRRYQN